VYILFIKHEYFIEKLIFDQTFKKVPNALRKPKIYYHVCKNPSLVPILSQMNPVNICPFYIFKMHFYVILLSMNIYSECYIFSGGFLQNVCSHFSLVHATYHLCLVFLDLIVTGCKMYFLHSSLFFY
jgi:hypothetical protein